MSLNGKVRLIDLNVKQIIFIISSRLREMCEEWSCECEG